mmetsp:Transcript_38095/g.64045  ORF Transcript_38095/g.64045 Transcript_38095/m.64045 type:complete len:204 (+) Transcript_38095:708-1319(+)
MVPLTTSEYTTQWSIASIRLTTLQETCATAWSKTGSPFSLGPHSTPWKRSAPGGKRVRKCFMMGWYPSSGKQFSTKVSPVCMKASIARSLATATVNPRGSNDACETQLAIMADLAVPLQADTTYSPPDSLPSAFAISGGIASFSFTIFSFVVSAWPKSVPDSSYSCSTASVGASFTFSGWMGTIAFWSRKAELSVSTGSSLPP